VKEGNVRKLKKKLLLLIGRPKFRRKLRGEKWQKVLEKEEIQSKD